MTMLMDAVCCYVLQHVYLEKKIWVDIIINILGVLLVLRVMGSISF